MLQNPSPATYVHQLRASSGALVGGMITDHLSDGYSAVYSFFDPNQSRRGLGVQLILTLIEEAQKNDLPYVYLGYWIAASRKMAYKGRFQPLQALGPQGWDWVDAEDVNDF
jgi:arginyl-tRNA--protein-N-Asp/Glu arginylyltransferase